MPLVYSSTVAPETTTQKTEKKKPCSKWMSGFLITLILIIVVVGTIYTSSYAWVSKIFYPNDTAMQAWAESGILVGGIAGIVIAVMLTVYFRDRIVNPWSSDCS